MRRGLRIDIGSMPSGPREAGSSGEDDGARAEKQRHAPAAARGEKTHSGTNARLHRAVRLR
jgi:hypothetical protein